MKKRLFILIALLLIPCFAWAGIVASGSVTQANAKKSLVDGAAFVDIAVDLSAYAHADSGDHKHIFKLIDSAGKVAWGYVGASGGGETLSALPNNITAISSDDPGVISSVAHTVAIGELVYFSGLTEMTELNGIYKTATAVGSADLFSIDDTSGYAAETTGGACGEEVTDCSTNGLHILSTKSGSVQNWAGIEAGFNYNDASGYTYEVKTIGRGASIW